MGTYSGRNRAGARLPGIGLAFSVCALSACMENASPTRGAPERNGLALALATVPPSFVDARVTGGLSNPTQMEFAPDGRIFVCEQAGKVRVIKDGSLLDAPFVALSVNANGERGVLGLAFDPAFASDPYVYVYYTSSSGPHNRVSRFPANGDVAGAEQVLLDLPALSSATNHNGGAVHFGIDGKLFVAVGDNANGSNSQSMETPLGKMLRIGKDGSIPADNPFFGSTSGINRAIWAVGLRNPFTFAVRPGTGRIFINDVGQNTWEEINDGLAGANYGWPGTEGNTSDPRYASPFYAYDHGSGACAISGGTFYDPPVPGFPAEYAGDYFFADYCAGWIKRIDLGTKAVADFAGGIASPTDLKTGSDGALYYLARGTGEIRKISYNAAQAPVISRQPASIAVEPGGSAIFTVEAAGTAPLAYQWQRDQADIAGATGASYTLAGAQAGDNGARFRCRVTNSAGSAVSDEAVLTVASDPAPVAEITAPAAGATFRGGQTIAFAGTGTDGGDGTLPPSSFTWEIRLWHDDGAPHSHPAYGPVSGAASGSFVVPDQGETSPNVWYRIVLTVRDAQGAIGADSIDILPVKAAVTLATGPAGLQLKLDGTPVTAPFTFTGVAGMKRTIEAVSPQTFQGNTWTFASWSDGGAAAHTLVTPDAPATYTASFQSVPSVLILEAEDAVLSGAVIASNHTGYTGTGFADYVHRSGDYVEWTVNVPAAGSRRLDFRYASAGGARTLRISVNGAVVSPRFSFPSTRSWNTWRVAGLSAALNAGANTVRAASTGGGGPNLDHLEVR